MLLIIATDAKNSGELRSLDGLTLIRHGQLPVLIKDANSLISLKSENKNSMQLYALSLNGERREKIPLSILEDGVIINIKLSKLQKEPTTYFELVVIQS